MPRAVGTAGICHITYPLIPSLSTLFLNKRSFYNIFTFTQTLYAPHLVPLLLTPLLLWYICYN